MLRLFTLTALIAVAAGPAFAAQDRYGPPRSATASPGLEPRPEPLAPWAKRLAGPQAQQPEAARGPEPLAPWAKRLSAARAAEPRAAPPPPNAPQRYTPPAPLASAPTQPLPAPARALPPAPVDPMAPRPWNERARAAAPQPTPLPVPAAAVDPMAPRPWNERARAAAQAPQPTPAAPGATARPRFYSVSRQYGAEPDPIPMSAPARGEAMTLGEPPVSPQLTRGPGGVEEIPVAQTKKNEAATRTARMGF